MPPNEPPSLRVLAQRILGRKVGQALGQESVKSARSVPQAEGVPHGLETGKLKLPEGLTGLSQCPAPRVWDNGTSRLHPLENGTELGTKLGQTAGAVTLPTYIGPAALVTMREVAPDEQGRFCAQCGYGRGGGLDPHLDGARVVWLHAQCWPFWLRERATSQ
jgi:hypothetical protein